MNEIFYFKLSRKPIPRAIQHTWPLVREKFHRRGALGWIWPFEKWPFYKGNWTFFDDLNFNQVPLFGGIFPGQAVTCVG
jgi:hypothetical protein